MEPLNRRPAVSGGGTAPCWQMCSGTHVRGARRHLWKVKSKASLCSLLYVWTWVWTKESLRGSLGLLGNPGTLWAPQVTKEETEAQGGWAGAGGTCSRSHSQPPGPQVSTSSILLSNSHAARGPGGGIKPTAQVAEGRPALASVVREARETAGDRRAGQASPGPRGQPLLGQH